ncbi:MAG: hypothetical protein ACRDH2_10040, partial [Anaerolineales bacterium]
LIRDPAKRGTFKTQALRCPTLTVDPVQIIKWFVLRWQVEVTDHEVRQHLGVATQRQWSDTGHAKRAHHARPAGPLLAGHAAGAPTCPTPDVAHPADGRVG